MTEHQPTLFDGTRAEAFRRFHAAHPEVYEELKRRALLKKRDLVKRRPGLRHRGSVRRIWEEIRDELPLNGSSGDQWKLNNNHTRFYARLLMEKERELVGFFEVRGK